MFATAGADPLSAALGVLGGLVSGGAAWWKASRTEKHRVDDAAWDRARGIYDNLMKDYERRLAEQDRDLAEARRRMAATDKNLALSSRRVDRLMSLMTRAGIDVPAEFLSRPWDNGDGGASPAPEKEP